VLKDLVGVEKTAIVAQGRGRRVELLQHGPFVVAVGQMNRSALAGPHPGLPRHRQPGLPAPKRELVQFAGRLADGPYHSEVSHGRADRFCVLFEDRDLVAAAADQAWASPTIPAPTTATRMRLAGGAGGSTKIGEFSTLKLNLAPRLD